MEEAHTHAHRETDGDRQIDLRAGGGGTKRAAHAEDAVIPKAERLAFDDAPPPAVLLAAGWQALAASVAGRRVRYLAYEQQPEGPGTFACKLQAFVSPSVQTCKVIHQILTAGE